MKTFLLAFFIATAALGQSAVIGPKGSGTSTGTNTGDVTIGAFGGVPDAKGITISGQAIAGAPADATHPGLLSAADWTTFNAKAPLADPTFTGTLTAAAVTTTGTVILGANQHLQLGAAGDFCSGNGAGTITCISLNITNNSNIGGALDVTGGALFRCGGTACKIGASGGAFTSLLRGTATLNFALAAAAACSADLTITVTGATVNGEVFLNVPAGAMVAGSQFQGWVSAADTVSVRHCCIGAATCDPASGTFTARVLNP